MARVTRHVASGRPRIVYGTARALGLSPSKARKMTKWVKRMMDKVFDDMRLAGRLSSLVCLALLSAYLALPGCGASPQQTARRTNHAIAIAVQVTDASFAPVYAMRARAALDAAADLASYRASMHDLDAVVTALSTATAAVEYLEHVVDLWDQGGAHTFPQALACAVGALRGLREVLDVAGAPIPVELRDALEMVAAVVSPDACLEHPSERP